MVWGQTGRLGSSAGLRHAFTGLIAAMCLSGVAAAQDLETGRDTAASPTEPFKRSHHRSYTEAEWRAAETKAAGNLAACETGDQRACVRLGEQYLFGTGVPRIFDIAVLLFTEACDAGTGEGCAMLGKTHLDRRPQTADFAKAADLYRRGCELGALSSCAEYSQALEWGYDRVASEDEADIDLARQVARDACAKGGAEACILQAGHMLGADASPDERVLAMGMLDASCRAGVEDACDEARAEAERADSPDQSLITQYYFLQCQAGGDYACWQAGKRLHDGTGTDRDARAALEYFDQACRLDKDHCEGAAAAHTAEIQSPLCDAGDEAACVRLGEALANGRSPIYDPATASDLLSSACLSGRPEACGEAAVLQPYAPEDDEQRERAIAIIERGCDAGHIEGCFRLADTLKDGTLLPSDPPREARIYHALCERGSASACDKAGDYTGIIPEIAIEEADFFYSPPVEEDGTEPVPDELKALLRQKVAEQLPSCPERSAVFRGTVHTDADCDPAPAAIGGYRLKPGQAPWQALLWRPAVLNGQRLSASQRVLCGGALVATGWVLTAAHCLTDEGKSVQSAGHRIRLGVYNPGANEGMSYPIVNTQRHPLFSRSNYAFDIALVQYDHRRGQRLGAVQTIRKISLDPLDIGQRKVARGVPVYSYGWGRTALGSTATTDYLQGVRMELRSEEDCRKVTKFRGEQLANAVLCAIGAGRQSTCNGDSGGPLVHYSARPVLIGVVSGGKACGTTGIPSRYPRVAKVRSWIERTIR